MTRQEQNHHRPRLDSELRPLSDYLCTTTPALPLQAVPMGLVKLLDSSQRKLRPKMREKRQRQSDAEKSGGRAEPADREELMKWRQKEERRHPAVSE